jgi:hypothetical protein
VVRNSPGYRGYPSGSGVVAGPHTLSALPSGSLYAGLDELQAARYR